MRFKLSFLILYSIFFLSLTAQTDKQTHVNQFVNTRGLQHASIGLCVKDYNGKVIAEHNKEKSYTPASTLKVITTATAFETLGSQYKYKTHLQHDINNQNRLLIVGSGDPTIGSEHVYDNPLGFIKVWTDTIMKTFDPKKAIKIIVVDNLFGYQGVSRKWLHEDIGNYFAAGAYGVSVADNTYRLSFNTEKSGEAPQIVEMLPKIENIKFTNTLTLNTTGEDNGYILGAPFAAERTIIGDIPAGRKKFTIKGDIPNPGLSLGSFISHALRTNGVMVDRDIETTRNEYFDEMYKKEKTKHEGKVFYTHTSPSLTEIARVINVKSNNHYAEHLIRTIGREHNKDIYSLPLDDGINKIKSFWETKGIDTNSLFMYDGCGLAPSNAVGAEFMCDMLLYMQTKSVNVVPFLNSFPLAGRDGTVRNFLKSTRLEGKVYVKSGSIANVQCYTGYYIDGDKKYTFSIMVNNYDAPRREVVKAIENLLLGVLN